MLEAQRLSARALSIVNLTPRNQVHNPDSLIRQTDWGIRSMHSKSKHILKTPLEDDSIFSYHAS